MAPVEARTVTVPARSTAERDATTSADPRTADAPARGPAEQVSPRRTARGDPADTGERLRADRIDETLTRLTAAHAGLVLGMHDRDDDTDEDDDTGERPAPRRTRPAVRVGRCVVAALALLLVLVAGLGWVGRTRLDGALITVAAVNAPDGVLDAAAQTGDENVLVLATDSGGSAGATTRANTVTVLHRDARGDRTVAVTLPPDLEITRPPCERWDARADAYDIGQTVPAEPLTTFDSAYAVGGPRCATRAAQQVTGLAITRFVAVDLAATSALVEAVGGVQVCVERPVLDSVLGPVVTTAGTGPLNGARAASLVRAADVRGEPAGGAALVQRQLRVLAAALARALSPSMLLHPGRVNGLLPALHTAVVSTGTGVADLLAMSSGLGDVRAVPTAPQANSRGNLEMREADAKALFTAVRTDAPLPAADQAADPATTSEVTADVLNASGRAGLAAEVAGTLGDLGFRTAEVRNAGQAALDTVVRFSPDRAEQARLLTGAVPSANAVPDPGSTGVLQLVLGRSFDGTVRAATAPEPAADPATAPATTCG
ncbi:MAG: LCP family protein [Pseudonocardia sp.]|nr:LCP family protein [Pseudonocardia sp.]